MGSFVRVGAADALAQDGERLHVEVEGRFVSVIRHKGKLFCMDSTCYHTGGPLANGDIEEVHGLACIVCPWHMYQVTLEDGAKLYESLVMGPNNKLVPGGWKRKERAQRVHQAERRADGIYVLLNLEGTYDSDHYGGVSTCGATGSVTRPNAARDGNVHSRSPFAQPKQPGSGQLPMRSGHVLNPQRAPPRTASAAAGEAVPEPGRLQVGIVPSSASSSLLELTGGASMAFPEEDQTEPAAQFEPLRVVQVSQEGSAGVRIRLAPANKETHRELFFKLFDLDETDYGDGSINQTEELFDTRHVRVGLMLEDGFLDRPFTPVMSPKRSLHAIDSKAGEQPLLDLIVRVYDAGALGPRLAELCVGDTVHVAPGRRDLHPELHLNAFPAISGVRDLFLFAAGSGITPLLQILQNALDRTASHASSLRVVFVCANTDPSRALGLADAVGLAQAASERPDTTVELVALFSRDAAAFQLPQGLSGRVEQGRRATAPDFLRDVGVSITPGQQLFAWCGPGAFMDGLRLALQDGFAVPKELCVEFLG